jgi:hypothetical protein
MHSLILFYHFQQDFPVHPGHVEITENELRRRILEDLGLEQVAEGFPAILDHRDVAVPTRNKSRSMV